MKNTLYKVVLFTSLILVGMVVSSNKVEAAAVKVAPAVYCYNGSDVRARCSMDYAEARSYVGRIVVNGWVNYGPWQARPGFGVIIP